MRFRPLALSYIIGVGVIALLSAAFVYPQISDRLEQAARARGVVEALRPAVRFVEAMALERGVYNQVLVSKATDAEESRRLVAERNAATDAVFNDALQRITRLPSPLQEQMAKPIEEAWADVRAARAEVEPLLSDDQPAAPEAAKTLVAKFAIAGAAIDRALSAAEQALSQLDPSLGLMLEVSRISNEMREQAGLRSTLLSRFAGTGKALSVPERVQAAEAAGALRLSWRRLQRIAAEIGDDKITAAVAKTKTDFFDEGEPIYTQMTDAARDGSKPPLDFLQWRAWTVRKLTQSLAARDPPIDAVAVRVQSLRAEAIRSLTTNLVVFGALFTLLLIVGVLVEARVLRPITRLTRALDAMADTRAQVSRLPRDAEMPAASFTARADEIGSLARAVQRIRDDAAQLERLNQRFDALLANLPQGVSLFDENDRLMVANPRYAELYGLAADAPLIGLKLPAILALREHAAGAPVTGTDDLLSKKLAGAADGEIINGVCELPNGRVLSLSGVCMPGGGWLATHLDITERRRIEEALRKSEARLSIALTASSTGLWDYFPIDDHAVFSGTWFTTLGYAPGDLPSTGATFRALVHPDDLRIWRAALAAHSAKKRETIDVELRMRRKDGDWAWIKTIGKAIERDLAGNPIRMIGIHIDVSETHRAQAELAAAKNEAERANKAKSDFLATMSHEIRTPMNAIIGLSHLLARTQLTTRQSDYLGKLQSASRGLLAIINDILDFSKIEAGKLSIESVEFDVDDLLRSLTAVIAPKTREKGLEFIVTRDPAMPRRLVGDPLRLSQILTNLLSNAAKFTESGEVIVRIGGRPLDDDRLSLEAEVSDTGIGMSADQIAALFRPFAQADASISRRFGGTGLGLAITDKLADLLDGQIEVESEFGVGSVFRFSAPIAVVEAAPEDKRADSLLADKTVLIVDDSAAARDAVSAVLRHAGATAQAAAGGAAALQLVRAGAQFDFILLDHKMPGMDGVETLRRLRAAGVRSPVAIAASSGRDTLQRALDAEFAPDDAPVGILEKPIAADALLARIRAAFGEASPVVPPTSTEQDPSSAGLFDAEALVVEDNAVNQQVAAELISAIGVRAQIAGSGEEALDILRHRTFDVILMDIQMPGMDGLATTETIRKELRIVDTPIIAMTANAMTGDRERCLAAGMNDHIAKPIDPDALARTLATWLRRPDLRRRGDRRVASPAAADPAEALVLIHFDGAAAVRNVNGNRRLLMCLLGDFATEHADDAAKIEAAVAHKDWSMARRLAHSLKGAALTLGASAVGRSAAELERLASAAEADDVDDRIAAAIASLSAALAEAVAEVATLPRATAPAERPARAAATSRPPLDQLLPLVDALSAKLADGDAQAEAESAKLAELLAGAEVGAVAEEVARLTMRFDFNDAIRALSELRAKLTSEVQNVVH
jgi:PAS domain S-box-containing protein